MNTEKLAQLLYDTYCNGVGGIAFNGDPLPLSEEFFADATKQKQADAWRSAAGAALSFMVGGIKLIADERARHEGLGFDADHDDKETKQQLAAAAALYAADGTYVETMTHGMESAWPWPDDETDKRGKLDRVTQLAIAGALCAAEIDRLVRKIKNTEEVTNGN